jgi:hypothetical protein
MLYRKFLMALCALVGLAFGLAFPAVAQHKRRTASVTITPVRGRYDYTIKADPIWPFIVSESTNDKGPYKISHWDLMKMLKRHAMVKAVKYDAESNVIVVTRSYENIAVGECEFFRTIAYDIVSYAGAKDSNPEWRIKLGRKYDPCELGPALKNLILPTAKSTN